MKPLLIPLLALIFALAGCDRGPEVERFQSFQTKNIWTQLLLDTRTGQLWQVSQVQDGGTMKVPINAIELGSSSSSRNGRFTLQPMPNVWNFMLTDTKTGKMWRCQYSMDDPKMRYIEPVQ